MSAPPQHFCTRKMHRQIYADFVVHTGRHAMPTYWASAPMTVTFDNENKSTPYAPAPSPERGGSRKNKPGRALCPTGLFLFGAYDACPSPPVGRAVLNRFRAWLGLQLHACVSRYLPDAGRRGPVPQKR